MGPSSTKIDNQQKYTTERQKMKHTMDIFKNYQAHLIGPDATTHIADVEFGILPETITYKYVYDLINNNIKTEPKIDTQNLSQFIKDNHILFIYTLENGKKVAYEDGYEIYRVEQKQP